MVSRKRPNKHRYGEPLRYRGVGRGHSGRGLGGAQGGAEKAVEPTASSVRCAPASGSR
jgi:hypothetical protein